MSTRPIYPPPYAPDDFPCPGPAPGSAPPRATAPDPGSAQRVRDFPGRVEHPGADPFGHGVREHHHTDAALHA
ncbi:hypothetical protein GCM10010392_22750 [Streptomyces clavifer]|nr:hypothetical protein GCM10010392_22750 [Streptomyces clavifer]